MKLADLLPPGVDLCQLPTAVPPEGQVRNLENPTTQTSLTLALSILLTAWAAVFTFGRLRANLRKLSWTDGLVLAALLLNIAEASTMIIFVKYFRHMWDVPLCWMNGQFVEMQYVWEMLNNFSLIFAKSATLLLFHQLFTVSARMRLAIRIGLGFNLVLYTTSIAVLSYFSAPHVGDTWDDLLVQQVKNTTIFSFYWAVAQGAAGTLLDVYIFILPLPVISRLNLSMRRRVQVTAIFLTAFLGVIASVVSLVYRVQSVYGPDKTWYAGVLMNCNLVEMNVAVIISSAPGFAAFTRRYVLESHVFRSMRSMMSGNGWDAGKSAESGRDPNQPRTGRDDGRHRYQNGNYYELNNSFVQNGNV